MRSVIPANRHPQEASNEIVVTDLSSRDKWLMTDLLRARPPSDAKSVAMALARAFRMKPYPHCVIKVVTIMAWTNYSTSAVERGLQWLRDNGFVHGKRGGRHDPVEYTLCSPDPHTLRQMTGMDVSSPQVIPVKKGLHTRQHADGSKRPEKKEGMDTPVSSTHSTRSDRPTEYAVRVSNVTAIGRSAPLGAPDLDRQQWTTRDSDPKFAPWSPISAASS
jgi:hypothetical protein